MSWADEKVSLDLTRDAIKTAPPYTMGTPLDRVEETNIYAHYARKGYWSDQHSQR